jgi:hypothetical protein
MLKIADLFFRDYEAAGTFATNGGTVFIQFLQVGAAQVIFSR